MGDFELVHNPLIQPWYSPLTEPQPWQRNPGLPPVNNNEWRGTPAGTLQTAECSLVDGYIQN